MKALIILENGFEDTEALATYDVLKRGGFELVSASFDSCDIITQCGHHIKSNVLVKDIKDLNSFDCLVIPGGKAVFNILNKKKELDDLVDFFYNKKKLIGCICAAPMVLLKRGYLDNLEYTCFPGCDLDIKHQGIRAKDGVVRTNNFITATSMYYSIPFGLEIVEYYKGKEEKEKLLNSLKGIR